MEHSHNKIWKSEKKNNRPVSKCLSKTRAFHTVYIKIYSEAYLYTCMSARCTSNPQTQVQTKTSNKNCYSCLLKTREIFHYNLQASLPQIQFHIL